MRPFRCHTHDGKPVVFNPQQVVSIQPCKGDTGTIVTTVEDAYSVKESFESVDSMLCEGLLTENQDA